MPKFRGGPAVTVPPSMAAALPPERPFLRKTPPFFLGWASLDDPVVGTLARPPVGTGCCRSLFHSRGVPGGTRTSMSLGGENRRETRTRPEKIFMAPPFMIWVVS